jgi:hypothetical protein
MKALFVTNNSGKNNAKIQIHTPISKKEKELQAKLDKFEELNKKLFKQ